MAILVVVSLMLLSACMGVPAQRGPAPANDLAVKLGDTVRPDIYRLGELEIRVYRDREEMVKDMPEVPRLVDGLRFGNQQIKLYGYHDRENKRIYTIDDIPTLLHEIKHYLDPKWEHAAPQFEGARSGEQDAGPSALRSGHGPASSGSKLRLPNLGCAPACLR